MRLRPIPLAALLALLAMAAPAAAAKPAASAAPKAPLSNTGRWITDARGRVVILHGLNMVYKRPPYQPGAVGFGVDDAKFLRRNGFNTIRLGLIYKAVEPQPGRYDAAYIRKSRAIERMLARRGVFSMIDFHQDLYNEKFGGEGWPDWAVIDDGVPAEPLAGFPGSYLTSPGLNRSFDNFWASAAGPGGVRLQDRYGAAWARVAASFRRDSGVLGYDLLNEPWPGSAFSTCANTAGCPGFDRGSLAPFYRRVIQSIRRVEKRHIVFYEPNVLFNFDANTNLRDLGFRGLGFSFHNYCLVGLISGGAPSTCPDLEQAVFDNADAHAQQTGDSLMLSEYGATDDVSVLERIAAFADQHMVSWQEWHYCGCDDPTTQGPGDVQAIVKDPSKPPTGGNVFRDKLKALARPYPQVIAGTPLHFSFDPASRRFELVYTRKRANGRGSFRRGLTEVFVPRIQYPGLRLAARVRGGTMERAAGSQHLLLEAKPHAKRIRLTITPKP
jgi:endoglycosylceramidase